MEEQNISESNHMLVKVSIFVEAGAAVQNMDPMKKEKEGEGNNFKGMIILEEIEDNWFEDTSVRDTMCKRYKGGKMDNVGQSLWRKYDAKLTELGYFLKKI
jgi:hypothetical protein